MCFMFKKIINFATVLFLISFNNSSSTVLTDSNTYYWYRSSSIYAISVNYRINYNVPMCCFCFDNDCFYIK